MNFGTDPTEGSPRASEGSPRAAGSSLVQVPLPYLVQYLLVLRLKFQ